MTCENGFHLIQTSQANSNTKVIISKCFWLIVATSFAPNPVLSVLLSRKIMKCLHRNTGSSIFQPRLQNVYFYLHIFPTTRKYSYLLNTFQCKSDHYYKKIMMLLIYIHIYTYTMEIENLSAVNASIMYTSYAIYTLCTTESEFLTVISKYISTNPVMPLQGYDYHTP